MAEKLFNEDMEKYIKSIKMLPSEDIRDMVVEYTKTKSPELLDEIIKQNLRLVYQISCRYITKIGVYDISDLIQEGINGVMIAAERFDPSKDYMFSTYAYWWIEQRISRFVIKAKNYYSGSFNAMQKLQKLKKMKVEKEQKKEELTIEEVKKELNVGDDNAKELLIATLPIMYLNNQVSDHDNETTEVMDFMEDKNSDKQYREIDNEDFVNYLKDLLRKYLTKTQYEVLMKRYGFYGEPMTLQSIGEEFGVSRERIRQIENIALRKLRNKKEFRKMQFDDMYKQ